MPTPTSIGVRISGLEQAQRDLGFIQHQIGVWSRSQIGAIATEPYAHWIEKGFYFHGRPGHTTPIRYMEQALDIVVPMIRGSIAESLVSGAPDASRTAVALSDRLVTLAQGIVTVKSGRLRASIRMLRAGPFFPVA